MTRWDNLHSNDETQISLQVLPIPLQNLRFCARVSSQILLAFSQVLQETPALAPSPTKKRLRNSYDVSIAKSTKDTLFSRVCTQNLRPSLFWRSILFGPTLQNLRLIRQNLRSILDRFDPQFLRQKLQNLRTIPTTKPAKLRT